MKGDMLAAVFITVLCGAAVDAVCDSTTPSKVQACVFQSDLFKVGLLPRNLSTVIEFCSTGLQTLSGCLADKVNECEDDDKQEMLVKLLIDKEKIMNGLGTMCNGSAAFAQKQDCLPQLSTDPFKSCVGSADAALINAGNPSSLNMSLDTMCTYFEAYNSCFSKLEGDCNDIASFYDKGITAIKYPYCSMSQVAKRQAIDDYQNYVSSSAGLVGSIMSITAAFVVSKIL
ncbi:uncharacterized protein LOC124134772 [Haliotis rufescens]|uniref:uncharacterized protein LOC124134772 n=1 Tax=Haliotis rufescens TaxID=6454 RepID=UPI001EAFEB9E|nr:uncharacterized protein LOC124134772 [Haliotis rufescens]